MVYVYIYIYIFMHIWYLHRCLQMILFLYSNCISCLFLINIIELCKIKVHIDNVSGGMSWRFEA